MFFRYKVVDALKIDNLPINIHWHYKHSTDYTDNTNKHTYTTMSGSMQFINTYLNERGESQMIERYALPPPFAYTSGDGQFRSDAVLGKKFKFFRYTKKFPTTHAKILEKVSVAWKKSNITEEDIEMLRRDHAYLSSNGMFKTHKPDGQRIGGNAVHFIKFYGEAEERVGGSGIRPDIKRIIFAKPCANCGTRNGIECDHKNDMFLENESRLSDMSQQTLDDFQPLCKHCNDVKREVKARTLRENKRQPAPGFRVKFTEGNETFNRNDPNWWKGTYWGDIEAFKQKLGLI